MEVLQVTSELELMLDLYRQVKPKRVLEIGSWDGGTLKEWLTQHKPDVVVAVDLEHRNREAYEGWRHPDTILYLYDGQSQEASQIAAMGSHAPYDWVFIDGDHGHDAVAEDVANCLPLVRPGGMMLLHDIVEAVGYEKTGPRRVFESLRGTHELTEIETEPNDYPPDSAHGIGVVQL